MKTKTQREKEFREDFEQLLKKHGAEITIYCDSDFYYGEEVYRANVEIIMRETYSDNQMTAEYTYLTL